MDTTTLIGYLKGWHGIYEAANEDSITNAEALLWINMARRRLSRGPKLRFTEFEDTTTTTASRRYLTLPDGWLSFTSLYFLTTNGAYKELIWYEDKKAFDKNFPNRTDEGQIKAAVQWGNLMLLGPVPDDEYTIYRSGFKLPTDLGVGETDDFLDEAWEAILFDALVLSGEYYTVPETKHDEWKSRAADGAEMFRKNYRTAKAKPTQIVTRTFGTLARQYDPDVED